MPESAGIDHSEKPAKTGPNGNLESVAEAQSSDRGQSNAAGLSIPGDRLREEALGHYRNRDTFQLYNDRYELVDTKIVRTVSQVGLATFKGAATYGIEHAVEHPFTFAGELAGAVALPIAMRGPAWTKIPAMAISAVGGASFAIHAVDSITEAVPAIQAIWDSPTNTKAGAEAISKSLGPLAFDMTVMAGAGVLGNRAATKLHEVDPVILRAVLSERAAGLAQTLGMGNQFQPAYAGVGRIPETGKPSQVADLINKPLQMSAHTTRSGADVYRYTKQNRPNGEVVHDFVNAKSGSVNGNTFNHADGTKLFFGHDGRMQVTFGSGQVRNFHLGTKIGHINIVEKPGGLKEMRLNGADKPQVATDNAGHLIKAKLADGSLLRHIDVNTPATFNHKDGLKTTVDPNGRLIFQLPGGSNKVVTLSDRIGQVRIIEHETGAKEISLWNPSGMSHSNQVDVPPLPKALTQPKPNSLAQQWKELQAKTGSGGMEAGPTGVPIKSTVEMTPQHTGKGDDHPFWRVPLPQSPHRAIVDTVVGIDHRTMPQSDLRTSSDIALAIQDHHWVVKDFLAGLGKGGNHNGTDFDW